MVSIPTGLINFTNGIFATLDSLDGISQAVGDPVGAASNRVSDTLTGKITGTGSFLENVPDFVKDGVLDEVTKIINIDVPNLTDVQNTIKSASGGALTGLEISNVAPQEITALSNVFNISKASTRQSMFQDPMQSFLQVNGVISDTLDTLKAVKNVIVRTIENIDKMISLQPGINYDQVSNLDPTFFATGSAKANSIFSQVQEISDVLQTNGKVDDTARNALCASIDDAISFFSIANTTIIEFEKARNQFEADINFLRKRFQKLKDDIDILKKYLPSYLASIVAGKVFRAASDVLFRQSGLSLEDLINDINFVGTLSGNRREKFLSILRYTRTLAAIKALLCTVGASEQFSGGSNPDPDVTSFESKANDVASELTSLAIEGDMDAVTDESDSIVEASKLATIRDNSATFIPALGAFKVLVQAVEVGVDLLIADTSATSTFKKDFDEFADENEEILAGPKQVLNKPGLDGLDKQLSQGENFDDYEDFNINQASQLGQFSEALADEIKQLPDGPDKDQLTVVKNQVDGELASVNESLEFDQLEQVTFDERVDAINQLQRDVNATTARAVELPDNITDSFNA